MHVEPNNVEIALNITERKWAYMRALGSIQNGATSVARFDGSCGMTLIAVYGIVTSYISCRVSTPSIWDSLPAYRRFQNALVACPLYTVYIQLAARCTCRWLTAQVPASSPQSWVGSRDLNGLTATRECYNRRFDKGEKSSLYETDWPGKKELLA